MKTTALKQNFSNLQSPETHAGNNFSEQIGVVKEAVKI